MQSLSAQVSMHSAPWNTRSWASSLLGPQLEGPEFPDSPKEDHLWFTVQQFDQVRSSVIICTELCYKRVTIDKTKELTILVNGLQQRTWLWGARSSACDRNAYAFNAPDSLSSNLQHNECRRSEILSLSYLSEPFSIKTIKSGEKCKKLAKRCTAEFRIDTQKMYSTYLEFQVYKLRKEY